MLEILDDQRSKGYSVRWIITEALLELNHSGRGSMEENTIRELNVVLNQANKLLNQIEIGGNPPLSQNNTNTLQSNLADSFILSINNTVKPGLKLE